MMRTSCLTTPRQGGLSTKVPLLSTVMAVFHCGFMEIRDQRATKRLVLTVIPGPIVDETEAFFRY